MPEWGRWLNADDISYLDPSTIRGLNLYAYCFNNPVMFSDSSGNIPVASIFYKTYYKKMVWGFENK